MKKSMIIMLLSIIIIQSRNLVPAESKAEKNSEDQNQESKETKFGTSEFKFAVPAQRKTVNLGSKKRLSLERLNKLYQDAKENETIKYTISKFLAKNRKHYLAKLNEDLYILFYLISERNYEFLSILLNDKNIHTTLEIKEIESLLMYAARASSVEIVKLILKKGAFVNQVIPEKQSTALTNLIHKEITVRNRVKKKLMNSVDARLELKDIHKIAKILFFYGADIGVGKVDIKPDTVTNFDQTGLVNIYDLVNCPECFAVFSAFNEYKKYQKRRANAILERVKETESWPACILKGSDGVPGIIEQYI